MFVIYTDCVSPHQVPVAKELVKLLGAENFRYVYRDRVQADRVKTGWTMDGDEPWMVWMGEIGEMGERGEKGERGERGEKGENWRELVENCEVLYTGFREVDLFERRAKKGLTTLYYSERWFKPVRLGIGDWGFEIGLPGRVRMLSPGYRRMARRMAALMTNEPKFYYLPVGIWATKDMQSLGVPEKKMIPWGYFVEPSKRLGVGVRPRCRKEELRVLYVGRLLALKRVDTIIRAVRELKKQKFHCTPTPSAYTLTIVGEGPEKARLLRLAHGMDNVSFKPTVPIDQVREIMREHDVLVFSSNALDGWGAVVSEALEEGLRVVGTQETGASATILPKPCQFPCGDFRALAERLAGEIPLCGIGEWTAEGAAKRLYGIICGQ